jgi:hypothetical protein
LRPRAKESASHGNPFAAFIVADEEGGVKKEFHCRTKSREQRARHFP